MILSMAQISDLRYESNVALVSSSLKRFWWDSNVRLKSRSKPTFDNSFRYSISILWPRHARISKSAFLYGNLRLDSGPFLRKYESLFVSFQSKIKKGLLFQMIYIEGGFFRSYLKKKTDTQETWSKGVALFGSEKREYTEPPYFKTGLGFRNR